MYPLFDDSKIDSYLEQSSDSEQTELEYLLRVARRINARRATHRVSTSLFAEGVVAPSRKEMPTPGGLVSSDRTSPWEYDVHPLLRSAALLAKLRPEIVLRVYLASNLEFLVEDLIEVGCEVFLMSGSSFEANPGKLWPFLALENEQEWITIIDPGRGSDLLADIERSEQAMRSGLGLWRLPYHCDPEAEDPGSYRPIRSNYFGAKGGEPIELLMKAFIWHHEKGTMARTWHEAGIEGEEKSHPIKATVWPEKGFDEWFLMAVIYPRWAFEGVLTLIPWSVSKLSVAHLRDVEYATWANPTSELCHCPRPAEEIHPWDLDDRPPTVALRPETELILRERERIGPAHKILFEAMADELKDFPRFEGSWAKLLDSRSEAGAEYWVDMNPKLRMGKRGAEIFLDRRYEECDVAVCGEFFVRVTKEVPALAGWMGLTGPTWEVGKLLKLPKLNGPITLWRSGFSEKFFREWREICPSQDPSLLLRLWMETKKARVVVTSARNMGWEVR